MASEEKFERHVPQNPLPEEIQKMPRTDTVCQFCGVSYLIHTEIKNLEDKLKATEAELAHYKGMEEREALLQQQLDLRQQDVRKLNEDLVSKQGIIEGLQSAAQSQQEETARVSARLDEAQHTVEHQSNILHTYRLKHELLLNNLPTIVSELTHQRAACDSLHKEVEDYQQQFNTLCSQVSTTMASMKETAVLDLASSQSEIEKSQQCISDLQSRNADLENKVRSLRSEVSLLEGESSQVSLLERQCEMLKKSNAELEQSLESEKVSGRKLTMQAEQLSDQMRKQSQDAEQLQQKLTQKDKWAEDQLNSLRSTLQGKESDLEVMRRDLHTLQRKLADQDEAEADIRRRASITNNQTEEIKELYERSKSDLTALKKEREMMITSHQNQIEQLRDSFRRRISDADHWPKKLEQTLKAERQKHSIELATLEAKLKESFVMEMQIHKQKHQQLLDKYQSISNNSETNLKDQINSIANRHKSEFGELHRQLAESKARSREAENALRDEIDSLKNIIKDLEKRLGKVDFASDSRVSELKGQVHNLKAEIDESRRENKRLDTEVSSAKQEIIFLQETVRNECEERFELTEALSIAKEELLALKKPIGGYARPGSSSSSVHSNHDNSSPGNRSSRTSEEMMLYRKVAKPRPPLHHQQSGGSVSSRSDIASANSISVDFDGDSARTVKNGTMSDSRKRIAHAIGRR